MASAPPSLGRPEIITIDVSGASRFARTFVQTVEHIVGCGGIIFYGFIAIGACASIAAFLVPMPAHETYIIPLMAVAIMLTTIASAIYVFCLPHRNKLACARRINIIPYDLTYIDVRRSVRKWLHRPFHRHPSVWATINVCAAIAIFLYFAINEKNIVEVRPDRCHYTWFYVIREYISYFVAMDFLRGCNPYGREIYIGGLVLSIVLLLNGVRIYGRSGGLPRYLVVLFLRVFIFISFGALWIAAILVAVGIVAIMSGSLVKYLWSLFMEGEATLRLLEPGIDNPGFGFSGLMIAGGLLAMLKDTTSSIWQPRLAAVERWLRRLSRAANLPSASFEERRDRRSPVLYLRSFHEDWRHIQDSSGEYDRLEEVIGAPLRELGPLVAVGKPGELAFPGAARAKYSDNEWQEVVASTMGRASFVVVVVGWTNGLQWEIETVKGRGHLGKSIWLLPPEVEHHSLVCDWLRANYRGTRYEQVVKAADLSRAILVHSEVDGKLVVISGTARDSGEYEAAIQIAVYGMVRHLMREATHRKRRQPIV